MEITTSAQATLLLLQFAINGNKNTYKYLFKPVLVPTPPFDLSCQGSLTVLEKSLSRTTVAIQRSTTTDLLHITVNHNCITKHLEDDQLFIYSAQLTTTQYN